MKHLLRVLYYLASANRRLYWSKKQLKHYQDKRLRAVIKYANAKVPYYHRAFKEYGVDIDQIRTIEDLPKLPFLTKETLKGLKPSDIVSSDYHPSYLKQIRTSGSTGKPLQFYINQEEDAWRKAIYMRANIACGQKVRDRWVVLTAPHHFGDTTKIQRKLGIFSQTCISLFESNDEKLREIQKIQPDVLDGYSGSLLMLAKEVKRRNIHSIRPRLLLGNAEIIDKKSRLFLEDVFGAPYCDQFGCTEVDRTAWQCLERSSYHLDVDSVAFEFINGNGEPVSYGESGEITYTSLFNLTMPLIRYKIGDVGVPSSEMCSCGINLPLMELVEGRKDSFLTLPNNRFVSPFAINLEASTFRYFSCIDQYHINQKQIDLIEIFLKVNECQLANRQKIATEFETHLRAFLSVGNEVILKTNFVDDVKFSNGGKLASVSSDLASH